MGNKVPRFAAPPPPPPKCSRERAEATTWAQNLTNTQKIFTEKKLAADQCSPAEAVARARAAEGPSACQVNDTELNMARNDISQKDAKWEQCYPEEATQRRLRALREEAQAYERQRRAEQREANASFNTKKQAIAKLADSTRELYKTLFGKEKELAGLVGSRTNLEQLERRERRLFLDSEPQSGAGGAPGVRTGDDRVLLAFWITYGAALIAGSILILQLYGAQLGVTETKSKAGFIALAALIGYGLAYYFISYHG